MKIAHLFSVAFAAVNLTAAAPAGDWPNFRGPQHDGISPESGFKKDWTTPLPLVWERKVGSAFSGMSVAGERLYTCGTQNKQQVLLCLEAGTGEVIWEKPFEKEYPEAQGGDGTRATPTIHDGRVYVLGARGKLLCCKADNGEELWSKQFKHAPQWGYSGSVLIEGELAIASGGKSDGSLVAYDRVTGQERWRTGEDPVGYATPYPFTFEGQRYVCGFMGNSALIVEAATGREVWRMKWVTDFEVNAAAPIFHDGKLFLSSGYRHGAILLELSRTGGRLADKKLWESRAVRNKFQSSTLFEGHLYTSDETALKCVEFATGTEKWKVNRKENGTLVIADGHVLFLAEDGEFMIAPATPAGWKPTTTAKLLSGRCWTVPTVANGKLYARDLERLVCFQLAP
jgi:outer membrane protein assembly factor BamB